jgi:glycerophosphoryl diester phosphodiesterase
MMWYRKTKNTAIIAISVVLLAITLYLLLPPSAESEPGRLAAYRGGGQLVDYEEFSKTGCTALSIVRSGNQHIENTLESLADSVSNGAEILHINIHRTKDDKFVVFHDWTLDCATNGSGEVRENTLAHLVTLDAGYGYTYDGSKTFPFRGKGYQISKLTEVLSKFPDHEFWLNLKDNDTHSFNALAELLGNYSNRADRIIVITSDKGIDAFSSLNPDLTAISVESTKRCFYDYLLYGWSGFFPSSCSEIPILLPPSKANYLWGYPEKFVARAQRNGSSVYLWAKHAPITAVLEQPHGVGLVTGDISGVRKLDIKPVQ